MRVIVSYTGQDVVSFRQALAAAIFGELTNVDVEIKRRADGSPVCCLVRQSLNHPMTVMRWTDGGGISLRRSWHHIRATKAGARLVYFVLQGQLNVVGSGRPYVVASGEAAVVNADEPFLTHTVAGSGGNFECALALVPEHLVLSRIPWADRLNASIGIKAEYHSLVYGLLKLLCSEGDVLSETTVHSLSDAFLQSVSEARNVNGKDAACFSVVDKRFADIQDCIRRYLTCSDLGYQRVAALCGISPRYLFHVLKTRNTTFARLMWGQRLAKARDWLLTDMFCAYPIGKVARMAGFKSAAHFSRLFKVLYGLPPSEFRGRQRNSAGNPTPARRSTRAARYSPEAPLQRHDISDHTA